jgi:hypothetical protein
MTNSGVEFIAENGGGVGVRLRKNGQNKSRLSSLGTQRLFVVNRYFFYLGFTKLIRDSPTLFWFRYFDYRFYSWPPPQYMSRLRMAPGFGPFGGKKNAD